MSALIGLFEEIEGARERALLREQGPWPKSQPTASDLSLCAREQALAVLHWDKRPGFPVDVLARFEVGRDAESPTERKLADYGFPVQEQQRSFELKGRNGLVILRGKIDGKIRWQGKLYPFDTKTVDPLVFPKLQTLADLEAHPFFSKWPRQIMTYEYLDNAETGFLLLQSLRGPWRLIEVPMDYEAMEAILARAEASVDAVMRIRRDGASEEEALPPFVEDTAQCSRCWARGRACFPPGLGADGLRVIDDAELEAKLRRREELRAASSEYEALDKEVKAAVRGKDGLLVGDFLVTGKELLVNYKAKPASTGVQWRTTIERLTTPPAAEASLRQFLDGSIS